MMSAVMSLFLAATFVRPMERVTTMDPATAQSAYDMRAIQLVYETPLAIDYAARPYRLTAGCCEMPQISADGRTYTLAVRTSRLTATDVVRALDRLRNPTNVTANSWMMQDVTSLRAVDARTVEIVLSHRVRHFSWLLAMGACAVATAQGEGTGPYELTHWRKNHEMVFTRRATAEHAGPRGFETIRYCVIDDMSTQWLMFLKGEIDFLGEVSRDNWDSIVGSDGQIDPSLSARGIRLFTMPTLEVMYVGCNLKDPILGPNRKLRQALNCAFDFPTWETFYNHRVRACDGPVPPGVAERLETPFAYRYDLAKARQLMVEAGYPNGIDPQTGRRLVLTLAIGRATQESREAGELMAAFYEKIGIRLVLDFMTWDAFLKATNEARVQLFRMGWVGDYPDAQNFLQLFHSANCAPGCNHANYESAAFDAAYAREDYRTCQEIVREDCPWIFTHFCLQHSLVSPRVGNYVPSDFPYGTEQFYTLKP